MFGDDHVTFQGEQMMFQVMMEMHRARLWASLGIDLKKYAFLLFWISFQYGYELLNL